MFNVTDSAGREINIKDMVNYETVQQDLFTAGEARIVEGVVIGFPCEGYVQVQPDEGAPVEVPGQSATITKSLVGEIMNLANDEALQEILLAAEARYNEEVAKGNTGKKSGKKSSASATKTVTAEINLEL